MHVTVCEGEKKQTLRELGGLDPAVCSAELLFGMP